MRKSKQKQNADELARQYKKLASKAFVKPHEGKLLVDATDSEMIAFHKMHNHFLEHGKCNGKTENLLRSSYPFVKVNEAWYVSTLRLYLYLFYARSILASFENQNIQDIFEAINAAGRYYDAAKKVDERLTPGNVVNLEDYQEKLSELYRDYAQTQMSIFSR